MTYKRLISFDFDDTMCHTPKPEEGKIIWKEKTGTEWPYGGWWGKAESINPEVFDIPVNPWVYKKYLEAVSDPDNYVILATGRLKKVPNMLNHVETILNKHNISFDETIISRIAELNTQEDYGARPIKRIIQNLCEDFLSDEILKGTIKEKGKIILKMKDGEIKIFKK